MDIRGLSMDGHGYSGICGYSRLASPALNVSVQNCCYSYTAKIEFDCNLISTVVEIIALPGISYLLGFKSG